MLGTPLVGHQVSTLSHAVSAVREHGVIYYFGIPDDEIYPINMRMVLRKNLTIMAGITTDHQTALAMATSYLHEHPELLSLITHTFTTEQLEAAYQLADLDFQRGEVPDARETVDQFISSFEATPDLLLLGVRVSRKQGDRLAEERFARVAAWVRRVDPSLPPPPRLVGRAVVAASWTSKKKKN